MVKPGPGSLGKSGLNSSPAGKKTEEKQKTRASFHMVSSFVQYRQKRAAL
jgi:hypothetical protein